MVKENVVPSEFLEQVFRFSGQTKFPRDKGPELQFGVLDLLIDVEQTR